MTCCRVAWLAQGREAPEIHVAGSHSARPLATLAGINPIILLFAAAMGAQRQRMRHLYLGRVGQRIIIDPAREADS